MLKHEKFLRLFFLRELLQSFIKLNSIEHAGNQQKEPRELKADEEDRQTAEKKDQHEKNVEVKCAMFNLLNLTLKIDCLLQCCLICCLEPHDNDS